MKNRVRFTIVAILIVVLVNQPPIDGMARISIDKPQVIVSGVNLEANKPNLIDTVKNMYDRSDSMKSEIRTNLSLIEQQQERIKIQRAIIEKLSQNDY